jgi:hypothetical protein
MPPIAARNAGAGKVFVSMQRATVVQNSGFGLKADGSGAGAIIVAASDSLFTGNGTAVSAVGGAGGAGIQITRSTIANSTTGLEANAATAFIFSSFNLITGNATGLSAISGGNLLSYKNNSVDGNFTTGVFTGALIPE